MTDPKQIAQRNKQRERQQRGEDFQNEIRESWRHVPNTWRLRIADGGGSTRPADELVLTEYGNLLIEMKRTAGMSFSLSMLRPNQIKGLIDFDRALPQNYGLVFVSFLNESKRIDEAYAFRLTTALKWMQKRDVKSIDIDVFRLETLAIDIPRLEDSSIYDLSEVVKCCKSL